ncbi:MAG TPA: 4Fe-4S binding protein [Thermoanaerobaculaceae bacterium]|nr:4Fe-4S binding protein [Thermoanaerobaculaceae bacterium]HPS79006.1 4Fe-4S binding protein [Thermoanaerobaculaceae bacterium]
MAHLTGRPAYRRLVDRLNRFPQGVVPSERLFAILELLFSEREAALVARLPIKPFTAEVAARAWKVPEGEARAVLDELASRAILLDVERDGRQEYSLPPPMAGFFEFSLMRLDGKPDKKALAELYFQYMNVEEEFIRALFTRGETQLGRTLVQEAAIPEELALHVLEYERSSHVIRSASVMGVSICYCRHKMLHVDRACDAALDICMTFGGVAASLIKHGHARRVDLSEGLDLLDQAVGQRLVQFGENVREDVSFICNCCGCCCEAMLAARRFGMLHPVHTTNFLPEVDAQGCTGCGACVRACPVAALALISPKDAKVPKRLAARVDEDLCLGCGVCLSACPTAAIRLRPRAARVITPVTSTHRVVMMAIERGKLQELVFDNQALRSHRAMAAILGVILKLPPLKQALASRQLKSRYLEALLQRRPARG